MQVLAGDIGGTKTALAIAEWRSGRLYFLRSRNYASAAYPGLEEIARDFLSTERRRPTSAAFGIAGPVRGGRAEVTKLPWSIDERQLARRLGIRRVRLVNDFIAAALGIPRLSRSGSVVLLPGEAESDGPIGVIGAGTGLGQAVLVRVDGDGIAVASEGGHADFGPRDEREDRLVRFVRKGFGRVDRDRLLSGEEPVAVNAPEPFADESDESILPLVAWSEIRVSSLGRDRDSVAVDADENRLTETGARADHADRTVGLGLAGKEDHRATPGKTGDSESGGDEIVDEPNP